LLAIADGGPASSVGIQGRLPFKFSKGKVLLELNQLRHLGLVQMTGGTRTAVWHLPGQRLIS
jgi:hypothetical protein